MKKIDKSDIKVSSIERLSRDIHFDYKAYKNKGKERLRLALANAAFCNDAEKIKLIAPILGDVDMQDPWGNTALMFAVVEENLDAVNALIRHGADPYRCSAYTRQSAISIASDLGYEEILRNMKQSSFHGQGCVFGED